MFVAFVATTAWIALGPLPSPPTGALDGGRNAIWLGHKWFSGPVEASQIDALLAKLGAHGVRDVYIHVGPLDARGFIPAAPPASWGNVRNRLKASGLRLFAWVGGVTRWSYGEAPDTVDASRPEVRAGIVKTARALLDVGHFDGIHYDLEVTPSGDAGLLALLDDTRATCGAAPLSVATPNLRPPWLLVPHLWTFEDFRQVAQRCDQIAVMSYDTGLPTALAYTRYVAWETRKLAEALPATDLRMGVPTYRNSSRSHRPAAETPAAALRGIALSGTQVAGIAIYAEWTTTDDDWALLPR